MTDLNIALLDKLYQEITPGQWELFSGEGEKVHYPTNNKVVIYSDEDCDTHPIADFSCNHTCRWGWDQESNARFVAELVNSWPSIREHLTNLEQKGEKK